MKLKKILALTLCIVLTSVCFTACSGSTPAASSVAPAAPAAPASSAAPAAPAAPEAPEVKQGEYVLKVSTVLTENDPLYKGLMVFQENVAARTNGAVEIQLFPSSQLGPDEDVIEQAKVGTNVAVTTDPGRLASYVPEFGIFGAPYLVDTYDEMLKLLDTAAYKDLISNFAQHGLRVLSFNYFQGTRHLFTKSPVAAPADLKGLRVRSSGSQVVTSTIEAMGANATVLPWAEAYQSLQQNVIEGVEVHYSAAVGASIPEVSTHLSKTAHFFLLTGMICSEAWYNTLPAEYQTIVEEEAYNGGAAASQGVLDGEAEFEKALLEGGLTLVDVDIAAFKEATAKVYDELNYRTLKDAIDKELGK